jgi:hypothetical protein
MRTFAAWKKENIDWDASMLDVASKKLIVDHLEAAWNDGQAVGLDRGLKADRFDPAEDNMGPRIGNAIDPKREDLLKLAGQLAVASMSNPGIGGTDIGEAYARRFVERAAAIIAEVDRVSGAPKVMPPQETAERDHRGEFEDWWSRNVPLSVPVIRKQEAWSIWQVSRGVEKPEPYL